MWVSVTTEGGRMSLLTGLLVVWGVVTAILIVLLIYRSTISMHEDDQLFLDDSASQMQAEQQAVLSRLNQLRMPLRITGAASGLLILVIFGLWLWRGLNQM
jgi:Tfp pilus assembly protein PilN